MPTRTLVAAHIALRVLAAIPGGYAFTWGAMSALVSTLFACGMGFHDAEQLAAMLGLLLYPSVMLWAFASTRLVRLWLVLVVGCALMVGLAALIQAVLLN